MFLLESSLYRGAISEVPDRRVNVKTTWRIGQYFQNSPGDSGGLILEFRCWACSSLKLYMVS